MKNILASVDFGNEAGDDVDPSELSSYFIEQPTFTRFLDLSNRIQIITAKKGVGKSALLRWLSQRLQEKSEKDLVILLRGSELVRSHFSQSVSPKSPNEYVRNWIVRLATVANRTLAQRIKLALSDDKISLIESAEIEGFRQRNFISSLVDRLYNMIPEAANRKIGIANEVEILKRSSARLVFLIDDLDATFQNSEGELLELSAFFSAIRYMAQDLKEVYFRVTLRTDVWPVIRRYDEALDKVEQYVARIEWNIDEFTSLIDRRLDYQIEKLANRDKSFEEIYLTTEPRQFRKLVLHDTMPWNGRDVDSYQVLITLSYERPRWAIQLLKLAQSTALKHRENVIYKKHIDMIWGEYGKKRIADLVAEHKHQCKQIEEIVNSFRGAERRLGRDDLFVWIKNRVLNHLSPSIDGNAATSPMAVAQFLYRIGFIIARSESEDKRYQHYHFEELPDLLSSRTNTDFGLSWEIHPCYREALNIKKLDEYQRFKRWR